MNARKLLSHVRTSARLLLLLSLLAPAAAAAADYVVIVNPANKATTVSRSDVQRYFFKHATVWPGGEAVRTVDLPKASPARVSFTKEVLGRSMAALNQFWAASVYSGRAVPPAERKSDAEVVEFVRGDPGAIGYVSQGASLDGVRRVAVGD